MRAAEAPAGAWDRAGAAAVPAAGDVTVVDGSTFCRSGRTGDVEPHSAQGLFVRDTRIVSAWRLRVDGAAPHPLTVLSEEPHSCRFLARVPTGAGGDGGLLLQRDRSVDDGMREELRLRNLGADPVECVVTLSVAADFADLLEVKEDRTRSRETATCVPGSGPDLRLDLGSGEGSRGVRVRGEGARVAGHRLEWRVLLPGRREWSTTVLVQPAPDGAPAGGGRPPGAAPEAFLPRQRGQAWRSGCSRLDAEDPRLHEVLHRSAADLGSLRIPDPQQPHALPALAARAPWFLALFGRDSLLSSYMALPLDPRLALGTLQALARRQGTKVDPATEEEPGRVPHEARLGGDARAGGADRVGGSVYYGSADATPLFVVLLGELHRWGLPDAALEALLPHADRALEWIERYGDRDGDGFVEYARASDRGLLNQGWKDSWDGVTCADGHVARAPLALCEVQGYVYAAYRARSRLAADTGDPALSAHWAERAAALREAFNARFWLPGRGWLALGLDADKRPVDALASNAGHCLWSGILDEDKARLVAEHLLSPAMFTGWGVRTLAAGMAAYNPMSCHNGSVWPHDNALIVAGLMRYGLVGAAQRVAEGVLDAAAAFGGRLPERFAGFDRSEYPVPVPCPTSCSSTAWAAAAPVQLLRSLLRLDPQLPRGRVRLAPALPARLGRVRLELALGDARVGLSAYGGWGELVGLPDSVGLQREPRPGDTHRVPPPLRASPPRGWQDPAVLRGDGGGSSVP